MKTKTEDRTMSVDYTESLTANIRHTNGREVAFIFVAHRGRPDPKGIRNKGHFEMRLVGIDGSLHRLKSAKTGHGLFDSMEDLFDLKRGVSMVTTSPYANTSKFNPFTDEVWAHIPNHLDPAKNRTRDTSVRHVLRSELDSWKGDWNSNYQWTVSLHPKFINCDPKGIFHHINVHVCTPYTSSDIELENCAAFINALTLAHQAAHDWNDTNNGQPCKLVK